LLLLLRCAVGGDSVVTLYVTAEDVLAARQTSFAGFEDAPRVSSNALVVTSVAWGPRDVASSGYNILRVAPCAEAAQGQNTGFLSLAVPSVLESIANSSLGSLVM